MSRFAKVKISIENETYDDFFKALAYYDRHAEDGQRFLNSLDYESPHYKETLIVDVQRKLPGLMHMCWELTQEADAIRVFLERRAHVVKMEKFKQLTQQFNRSLSDRTAEKYAEADPKYISILEVIGEVKLRVEKLSGHSKGLDALHWQVRSLIELHKAGKEDALM